MGLGPSTKMTTLHHFDCPVTKHLLEDEEIDFLGVIVDGVSENFDKKTFTAKRAVDIAKSLGAQGALVAIDGWGNHHMDFVSIIDLLGKNNIPSVGLSYLGTQGKLVATSPHVKKIVDFNKSETGFESCVVGQNNLEPKDAMFATVILKNRLKRFIKLNHIKSINSGEITRQYINISSAQIADVTKIENETLFLDRNLPKNILISYKNIKEISINFIKPKNLDVNVNSNLDFIPIVTKNGEEIGFNNSKILNGICTMLTAVDESGFQPSNIGSSNGVLGKQVVFDKAGTPKSTDILLHIDVTLKDGQARTAHGIEEAHKACDLILESIRRAMIDHPHNKSNKITYHRRPGAYKVCLIKIVSGLGNMYDTSIFPSQPAGILGSYMMRDLGNMPFIASPLQILDGCIHSLL